MRRLVCAILLASALGASGWAQGTSPAGALGMELVFTPLQTPYLTTAVTLTLACGPAEIQSRTVFPVLPSLGPLAEHLTLKVNLGGVHFTTGLRFDPCFSRYWFEVRGGCCPLELGGLFLVENLAPACQIPNWTIGLVLDVALRLDFGLTLRSLTAFGVKDLYNLIDDNPYTDLTAVAGWFFEEQLVYLGFTIPCLMAESLVLFNTGGFAWWEFGAAYRFSDPWAELGFRARLSLFSLHWAKLSLGVRVPPVMVRLTTTFNLGGFLAQEVWVELSFSWVRLYSGTEFDFSGLIRQVVGFELRF